MWDVEVRYYLTPSGLSPVRKFVEQLPREVQEDFLLAIDRLQRGEQLAMPLSKPLFDVARGLRELRLREPGGIYRVFYFVKKREALYLIHAMKNKTQKLLDRDKRLILKRLKEL